MVDQGSLTEPSGQHAGALAWIKRLRRFADRPWPASISALLMLVGALTAGIVVGQTATTGAGQVGLTVISTNGSSGLNASNDALTWIGSYQPSQGSDPTNLANEITFDDDLPYQSGSIKMPSPRWTTTKPYYWRVQWKLASNNIWTSSEPANGTLIKAVKFDYVPPPPPVLPSIVDFRGTGDGFDVTAIDSYLYVVNHHSSTTYLKCRNPYDVNTPCVGWAHAGMWVPLFAGQDFNASTSGVPYWTTLSTRPIYAEFNGSKRLYFTVIVTTSTTNNATGQLIQAGDAGYLCADVVTLKSCGFTKLAENQGAGGAHSFDSAGIYNGRAYGLDPRDGRIYCFEPANNANGGIDCTNRDYSGKSTWVFPSSGSGVNNLNGWHNSYTVHDGIIIYNIAYRSSGTGYLGAQTTCFDYRLGQPCSGTWPVLLKDQNGNRVNYQSFVPTLTASGALNGFCFSGPNPTNGSRSMCYDMQGSEVSRSTSLTAWAESVVPFYKSHAHPWVIGTRVFTNAHDSALNKDFIGCFDFGTGAPCLNFPKYTPSQYRLYTVVPDRERPHCIWALGDAGSAMSVDPRNGQACATYQYTIEVVAQPQLAYAFDANLEATPQWRSVALSSAIAWGSQIDRHAVDASGNKIGAKITVSGYDSATQRPTQRILETYLPEDTYSLDISNINYRDHPQLHVMITIKRPTSAAIPPDARADVLWSGPPMQFAVTTKPPANVCQLGATMSSTQTSLNGSVPIDNLATRSNTIVSGIANSGYGLTPIETAALMPAGSAAQQAIRFQPTFNETTGQGRVDIYKVSPSAANGTLLTSTANIPTIGAGSRVVLTSREPGSGFQSMPLRWSGLSTTDSRRKELQRTDSGLYLTDPAFGMSQVAAEALAEKRLNYLRGDRTHETGGAAGGHFRNRGAGTHNPIGMPIGSGMSLLLNRANGGAVDTRDPGYATYVSSVGRVSPMIFMAANDGMLHAWKASWTGSSATVSEAFHFMPSRILKRAFSYAERSPAELYRAPYYLDSTPMLIDVDLSNGAGTKWRTLMLGAFGRGAPGAYALDVTKADVVTEQTHDLALWEVSEQSASSDLQQHMGYMIGQPLSMVLNPSYTEQVVKVKSGSGYRYAWITGNGLDSRTGSATLFVFYLDGYQQGLPQFKTIVLDQGPRNGLSTPRPFDSDGDGIADLVYVGDYKGQVWRVDISDLSGTPPSRVLFNTGGERVVAAPLAIRNGNGQDPIVLFGTGKYEITPMRYSGYPGTHYLYGVYDRPSVGTLKTLQISNQAGDTYRTITVSGNQNATGGWKAELPEGEALVANPMLHPATREAVFISIRPPGAVGSACSPGWSYEYRVNALTGQTALGFAGASGSAGSFAARKITGRVAGASSGMGQSVLTSGPGSTNPEAPLGKPAYRGRVWWREVLGP